MEDLRQQFAENPQAAVTFATTEHFNLQTERAATIGEANGRASILLGSVSPGLIALGFAAQGSSNSGQPCGPSRWCCSRAGVPGAVDTAGAAGSAPGGSGGAAAHAV